MMNHQNHFYLCKAEVEQRHRDIKRAIDEARKLTDSPKVWDLLSSIFHHSDMAVDCFKRAEREMDREMEALGESMDGVSILDGMENLKKSCEKLLKEAI